MAIEISEVIMRGPGAEFNGLAINNPDQLNTSSEGNYTVIHIDRDGRSPIEIAKMIAGIKGDPRCVGPYAATDMIIMPDLNTHNKVFTNLGATWKEISHKHIFALDDLAAAYQKTGGIITIIAITR